MLKNEFETVNSASREEAESLQAKGQIRMSNVQVSIETSSGMGCRPAGIRAEAS